MKAIQSLLLGFGLIAVLIGGNSATVAKIDDGFQLKQMMDNSSVLSYHIPAYELLTIETDGKVLTKPVISHSGSMVEPGEPDLPSTSTFYAVEPGKIYSVQVNIIASEMVEDVDIPPLKTWDNKLEGIIPTSPVYDNTDVFPESIVGFY